MSRKQMNEKVEAAAKKAYEDVKNPSSFQDQGHNQYFNRLCFNLHAAGVSFEREKKFGEKMPDIFIEGFGVVEVKAKRNTFDQGDKEQGEAYADITKLPCLLINFGTQGGPTIREFK